MADEALRAVIASKLAEYRKKSGLTQAQLAEKLNYSDKSVSKWERGDGVPDIFVLTTLARLYGVSVNELVYDQPPEAGKAPDDERNDEPKKQPLSPGSKLLIGILSVGLVWLVTVIVFFALMVCVPELNRAWLVYIVAIPVSAIVAVVFTSLWSGLLNQFISVSALVWSVALAVHVAFVPLTRHFLWIYLVALIMQILTALWFLLRQQNRRIYVEVVEPSDTDTSTEHEEEN